MSNDNARIRTWAYTVQNPSELDLVAVESYRADAIDWCVVAAERGEKNGVLHYQGAVRFKHGKSFKAAFKFLGLKPGDNLASMRSSEFTNAAYCLKGSLSREDWESEGVEHEEYGLGVDVVRQIGTLPKMGDAKTSVWDDILQAIHDGWSDVEIVCKWPTVAMRCMTAIAGYRLKYEQDQAAWRDVETVYLSGDTGTGKTRYVMEKHGYSNVYRVTNYDTGAFDQYDGQEVVVFEEFRSGFKIQQMLNFLDGYPVQLPARYANKMAKFTKVYLITNWDLLDQYQGVQTSHHKTWEAFLRRIDGEAEVLGEDMIIGWKDGREPTVERLPWLEDQEEE